MKKMRSLVECTCEHFSASDVSVSVPIGGHLVMWVTIYTGGSGSAKLRQGISSHKHGSCINVLQSSTAFQ